MMKQMTVLLTLLICIPLFSFASAVDPSQEEVSFSSSDGFQLEGTLRLPASASSTNPVPGVVLIHGSGEVNRDELVSAFGNLIPIFAEIGDALQRRGIAVLTYDKRICSSFNDCYNNSYPLLSELNVTVDAYIEDALAAVQFLKTRSEIHAIVAVGHSQGATYIPILLESEPAIVSGVMVAGSFRPFDELSIWQHNFNSQTLGLFGVNASLCIPGWDFYPEFFQWLEAIRNGTEVSDIPGLASVDHWKSLLDVHAKSLAATSNIDQPLLLLHGDMDWMVPPSDLENWSQYLSEVGANYDTHVLPCVTHLLNCIKRFPYDIGKEVDPQVKDSLIDFVLTTASIGTSGIIHVAWDPTLQIMSMIAVVANFF